MTVTLIARPQFLGLPAALGTPREDQLQGPDAQKLIETAARTCYDSFGKGRGSDDHARHILSVNHGSVLEHGFYSFFITDASRGWSHEHVRHRVGIAISQRSTRYADETDTPWIMHPLLRQYLDAEQATEGTAATALALAWDHSVSLAQHAYATIVARLEEYLTARGTDKLTARKQARGAARGILGNALMTEMVWSANVRMLRTVIDQRANPAADAEIRGVAIDILRIMQKELPIYFEDYTIKPSDDGIGEIATR